MFKSVESLIKTNNGFFKSEKQAKFLIDQLNENIFLLALFMAIRLILLMFLMRKVLLKKSSTILKQTKRKLLGSEKLRES